MGEYDPFHDHYQIMKQIEQSENEPLPKKPKTNSDDSSSSSFVWFSWLAIVIDFFIIYATISICNQTENPLIAMGVSLLSIILVFGVIIGALILSGICDENKNKK